GAAGAAAGSTGTAGGASAGRGGSAAGSGGTPGTGGAAAGAGGKGGAGPSGAVFYSEDFESGTAGKQPAGWDNFISYNFNTTNPQSDGTGATIDATRTHNNSKFAVHFKSTGNPAFIERPLPTGTKHLFVRAYFYST